jgi:hypothetical protein
MNTLQLIQHGGLWGIVFSAVFCAATLLIGRVNAAMLLNDYPLDIRLQFGPMSAETRQQANRAGTLLLAALLAILAMALVQLRQITGELTPAGTFLATVVMLQVWNLADLVILDWFILMTLKPRFMVLPGTEGMPGYSDYGYHLRKFLNGIVLTLILSGIITAIALGIEALV